MNRLRIRRPAGPSAPRVIDRRKNTVRHRRWIVAAFVLPVVLCAVIGFGVYLMWHRQMALFRPPPVGQLDAAAQFRHG